jgi:hypothetical protein
MSFSLDVEVILSLRARIMCIAQDSTQSYISKRTIGVGTYGKLGRNHRLYQSPRTGLVLDWIHC